jgi:hypothetical protein
MEESILVELVESLNSIFSHNTSNEQRQVCQKKVDDITLHPTGILYASKLAHVGNGFSDQIRHFGVSSLCSAVKFGWANMSSEEQLFLKNTALQLMRNVTFTI